MDVVNNHEMLENQVMLHLQGSLADPSCLVSARSGMARLHTQGQRINNRGFSTKTPEAMLNTAFNLRDDALQKLAALTGLGGDLNMQGMIRDRKVKNIANYQQAFAGFWGTLRIENHWDTIFGTNPEGEPEFRRGPWEEWSVDLPDFDDINPSIPIVLSPYCATLFHEAVGHALEEEYLEGSPLKFYHGEKVSNEQLTIMDRPDLAGYAGSMTHDDVGWPVSETTLIQQGFLVGDLSKNRAAHRRASFRDGPLVRATNFVIKSGADDPHAWLSQLGACYYVSWVQSGNWHAGHDHFRVLTGPIFLLHHGQPAGKRSWCSFKLTIGKFLSSISGVGNDMVMDPVVHWCVKQNQRVPMSMGSPSILLEGWS